MPGLVYMYRHKLESLLDGRMENQKFACRFESGSYPFRSEVYNSKHYEVIYIISILNQLIALRGNYSYNVESLLRSTVVLWELVCMRCCLPVWGTYSLGRSNEEAASTIPKHVTPARITHIQDAHRWGGNVPNDVATRPTGGRRQVPLACLRRSNSSTF